MKSKLAKTICAMLTCATVLFQMVGGSVMTQAAGNPNYYVHGSVVADIYTDKAMYNPGDTVKISLTLKNETGYDITSGKICLQARHLNQSSGERLEKEYSLKRGESSDVVLEWCAPGTDFTGYLLEVDIYDGNGSIVDTSAVGVDVSSSWIKFPRYGYLHDFGVEVDTAGKIAQMNRFHINGIEYYDWHYRHHEPLPATSTKENLGVWDDWTGRLIYGDTIRSYITSAKERNMANMAYDMIYAGTDDFFKDNAVTNTWKIKHRDSGEDFMFTMGDSPSGNGHLYFVNPMNTAWQNHIFAEMNRAIDTVGFDGYHGDTVGDWGEMTDFEGNPLGTDESGKPIYSVLDTYKPFLNACKANLSEGKYLSFNPVGAKGIINVNESNSDVLYTEFWPWDTNRHGDSYTTYAALVQEVEDTMNDSKATSFDGKGKSLVVKAYINYTDRNDGYMNDPAVLLADAAVFAAGGSRIEVGNGDHMLHHEYYPSDRIKMTEELKADVVAMYDFAVAYENLLRDGQVTTNNEVVIDGFEMSRDGKSDTIWAYTRADSNYEILHLINLRGTDNEWRDMDRTKKEPIVTENIKVRYYVTKDVNAVYLASADEGNGRSRGLAFEKGNDGRDYVEFVVPSLEYWDMIYMSSEENVQLKPGESVADIPTLDFRMEGETATLYPNGGNPVVREESAASGGAYICDIGAQQGIAEFTVPDYIKRGTYTLRFGYSSGTSGAIAVRVNEKEYLGKYEVTDPGWAFALSVIDVPGVELKAGDKITVSDAYNNCFVWLDYMSGELEKALEPVVIPEKEPLAVLEAEAGRLVPKGGQPVIESSENASSGKYVHDIGLEQGYVELTVPENIEKGCYKLRLGYSSGVNGGVKILVNDTEYREEYRMTGGWEFLAKKYIEVPGVNLQPGDTVRISDALTNCWIWLDYVAIYELEEAEIPTSTEPEGKADFILEAENGVLTPNGGNPVMEEAVKASNGKFVHDIGFSQGYVELTVPEDVSGGKYTLLFRYSSGTDGEVSLKVNGSEYIAEYTCTDESWAFVPNYISMKNVSLKAGDVIRVSDAKDGCWIWLDCIKGYQENKAQVTNDSKLPVFEVPSKDELLKAIFGDEAKTAEKVALDVKAIENLSAEEDELVKTALKEKTIGLCFDISMYADETQISELKSPIALKVGIPTELQKENRTFSILRIHNGAIEELRIIDKTADTLTMETDKFSTYILVYEDGTGKKQDETAAGQENGGQGGNKTDDVVKNDTNTNSNTAAKTDINAATKAGTTEKTSGAPDTGDKSNVCGLILLGIGMLMVALQVKKQKEV